MGGGGGEAGKVDLEHGAGEIQAARQFQRSPPLPNIKFHLKVEMLSLWQTEAFLVVQTVKNLPVMQETQVQSLGREDLPGENGMSFHSRILAWRIPWTEEPGGLWSKGLQRVQHN